MDRNIFFYQKLTKEANNIERVDFFSFLLFFANVGSILVGFTILLLHFVPPLMFSVKLLPENLSTPNNFFFESKIERVIRLKKRCSINYCGKVDLEKAKFEMANSFSIG